MEKLCREAFRLGWGEVFHGLTQVFLGCRGAGAGVNLSGWCAPERRGAHRGRKEACASFRTFIQDVIDSGFRRRGLLQTGAAFVAEVRHPPILPGPLLGPGP